MTEQRMSRRRVLLCGSGLSLVSLSGCFNLSPTGTDSLEINNDDSVEHVVTVIFEAGFGVKSTTHRLGSDESVTVEEFIVIDDHTYPAEFTVVLDDEIALRSEEQVNDSFTVRITDSGGVEVESP